MTVEKKLVKVRCPYCVQLARGQRGYALVEVFKQNGAYTFEGDAPIKCCICGKMFQVRTEVRMRGVPLPEVYRALVAQGSYTGITDRHGNAYKVDP